MAKQKKKIVHDDAFFLHRRIYQILKNLWYTEKLIKDIKNGKSLNPSVIVFFVKLKNNHVKNFDFFLSFRGKETGFVSTTQGRVAFRVTAQQTDAEIREMIVDFIVKKDNIGLRNEEVFIEYSNTVFKQHGIINLSVEPATTDEDKNGSFDCLLVSKEKDCIRKFKIQLKKSEESVRRAKQNKKYTGKNVILVAFDFEKKCTPKTLASGLREIIAGTLTDISFIPKT